MYSVSLSLILYNGYVCVFHYGVVENKSRMAVSICMVPHHTVIFYHKRHFNINYTYEVISLLIFAYKAAGSTPATGRMAVLHIQERRSTGVDRFRCTSLAKTYTYRAHIMCTKTKHLPIATIRLSSFDSSIFSSAMLRCLSLN